MELVNKNYAKLNRDDIYSGYLNGYQTDKEKYKYYQKVVAALSKYENRRRKDLPEIYVERKDLSEEIPIKRQTLINAYLYACLNGKMDIANKIKNYIVEKEVSLNELGEELSDYVLEHSININEYFDEEHLRPIYSNEEEKIKEGYIFNLEEQKIK